MFAMRTSRGGITWIALLAVIFYGLAPALASLTARGATPVTCLATEVHTCSCKVDVHAKDACCCSHGPSGGNGQTVKRLPCSGEPAADGSLWTTAHQLPAPSGGTLYAPATLVASVPSSALVAVRGIDLDHPTPPPRA